MSKFAEAKRKILEEAAIRAALSLAHFLGVSGFRMQVLHTDPPTYLTLGHEPSVSTKKDLRVTVAQIEEACGVKEADWKYMTYDALVDLVLRLHEENKAKGEAP